MMQTFVENLCPKTLDALQAYRGDCYRELNLKLRLGKKLDPYNKNLHRRMLKAIIPASDNHILYRGSYLPTSYLEKQEWREPAWTSSTPQENVARGFMYTRDVDEEHIKAMWEIHVAKGHPVIYLGKIVDILRPGSGFAGEVVLAPNTKFTCEKVIKKDERHHFTLQALM